MGIFQKLAGIIGSKFQIDTVNAGPHLKNNAGVLEVRNAGDSAYAVVRGGAPVNDNDLTNKQYVDTINKPIVVTAQFDGGTALPSNSGVEHFYVVTTSGVNATIGQLLWDDGSGSGTVTTLTALEGRSIFTSAAFSGGTISLSANSYYVWDTVSGSWLLEANPAIGGATRVIRYAITNAATQDSATLIPANAYVLRAWIKVTTPYSGGATISVGQAGGVSLLIGTGDNLATVAGTYEVPQEDTAWGASALAVRTTVGGTPAAGAGVVYVEYSVPNA